ncbi:CCL5 protein, partial [Dasyornis broadbenti]|nr:CCL5 protein [Dasyornis broadbenti]
MKISLALLMLLLAAACTGRKAVSFRSPRPTCCPKEMLFRRKIQASRIQEFRYTASSCALKAVLVKLPKLTLCVDPEEKWFQEYLRMQKKPNTSST